MEVVELHDCLTPNELITYEARGRCSEGGAESYIRDGRNSYGGDHVTNPSGGLLSKGHPPGATGLAQCYELTHQLRGTADARQVQGALFALQPNLRLRGACVVTLYANAACDDRPCAPYRHHLRTAPRRRRGGPHQILLPPRQRVPRGLLVADPMK